ncbi:hypothetical protein [Nostoc sp. FACHB-110]|uniref:hypothetical protein n=1 Tax=Nostoc sp. FACHB-110 TaxID=2692834 RepID=UPI0016884C45|nr:hypothetical protein [Nostoc sp. FACHB-110]MBD2438403.1 hypothetical protein [Nostoc sp. FACHB-110]
MKTSETNQPEITETPSEKFMKNKIDPFIKEYQYQVNFNRLLGILFSLTSIGLSLGVTLAGIYGKAHLAAGLGAASAAVQTAFGIFPLEKRVWFYRASVAEAQKIKSFLEYKTDYTIDNIVDDFEVLRTKTLTQEPLNSIPDSFSPNSATDKQPNASVNKE